MNTSYNEELISFMRIIGTQKSWNMNFVSRIVHGKRVMLAMVDQCRFGLTTTDKDGKDGPARKRYVLISSSWAVIDELHGTCDGLHEHHNHLIDGRAKEAAIYQPRLCRAISRGIIRQHMIDETGSYSSPTLSGDS